MMTSLWADFLSTKKNMFQQLFISVIVGSIIAITCGTVDIVPPMIMFMTTVQLAFTLFALDELNNWEAFRSALPLSRGDIFLGRSVFILGASIVFCLLGVAVAAGISCLAQALGESGWIHLDSYFDPLNTAMAVAACALVLYAMLAATLPLIAKSGMTKSVRFMPLVFALLFLVVYAGSGFDLTGPFQMLENLLNDVAPAAVVCAMIAVGLALYAASSFAASRLYERREF